MKAKPCTHDNNASRCMVMFVPQGFGKRKPRFLMFRLGQRLETRNGFVRALPLSCPKPENMRGCIVAVRHPDSQPQTRTLQVAMISSECRQTFARTPGVGRRITRCVQPEAHTAPERQAESPE